MSEAKFTAAPWRAMANPVAHFFRVIDSKCRLVATVPAGSATNPSEVAIPNAHLIAAAPDLYEALDRAAMLLHGLGFENSDEYQAAMSVLEKARGES